MNFENIKKIVINNVGSFIAVLIFFGSAWIYLDNQRSEVSKTKEELIKLKAETDVRERYLAKKEENLSEQNAKISLRENQLARTRAELEMKEKAIDIDTELRKLASKYLEESSSVDTSKICDDDELHNSTVRKAAATLSLIESIAKQHNKPEFISFARHQSGGMRIWGVKCKP